MISPNENLGSRLDTSNQFEVLVFEGCRVSFRQFPDGFFKTLPCAERRIILPRHLALNLAAWIVAMADPEADEFASVLEQILHKRIKDAMKAKKS